MINSKAIAFYFFLVFAIPVFSQANKEIIKKEDIKLHNQIVYNKTSVLQGYPVAPFSDTLFFIYNKLGSFKAETRARAIEDRIKLLSKDRLFNKKKFSLTRSDISVDIVYDSDFIVMAITNLDGKIVGSSDFALAQKNLAIIQKIILSQKENTGNVSFLKLLGLGFLLIVLVVFIVFGITLRVSKRY